MAGVHAMLVGSGGGGGGDLYLKPNGVTVAAASESAKGKWHTLGGKNYYVAVDYDDLVSVVSVYKGLTGAGEVLANLTRDGQTFYIPLNQVVTTYIDKLGGGTYTTGLFSNSLSFNQLINSWDVSNVTSMIGTFYFCRAYNQLTNSWDVSNVTNMNSTFRDCSIYNQPMDYWDTSNVTNMLTMFYYCGVFNQDISSWCVSKIPSKPAAFDSGTSASWTTARKPSWGAAC